MEIKNKKKVLITRSNTCLVIGLLSAGCLFYWLVQAFFYGNEKFLMIILSFTTTIAGLWYGIKKRVN